MGLRLSRPQPLQPHHDLADFRCGDQSVEQWLQRNAQFNARNRLNRVCVVIDEDSQQIAAIYALTFKQLEKQKLLPSQSQLLRRGPALIPAFFIGQFAVASEYQGKGLGRGLVRDIFQFLLNQTDSGIPAPLVYLDASQENAAGFWAHMGFKPCPELGARAMVLEVSSIAETAAVLDHPDTQGARAKVVLAYQWLLRRFGVG